MAKTTDAESLVYNLFGKKIRELSIVEKAEYDRMKSAIFKETGKLFSEVNPTEKLEIIERYKVLQANGQFKPIDGGRGKLISIAMKKRWAEWGGRTNPAKQYEKVRQYGKLNQATSIISSKRLLLLKMFAEGQITSKEFELGMNMIGKED